MKEKRKPSFWLSIGVSLLAGYSLWLWHQSLGLSNYYLNKGISFGGLSEKGVWVGIFSALVVVCLLKIFRAKYGAVVMAAGAWANLIDRCLYSGVRDYCNFLGLFWNNINDWVIGWGMVILLIEIWKENTK